MTDPLQGIYVPRALREEAEAFSAAWSDGTLRAIEPGFSGDAVLWVARLKGKGPRRSFAGYVRVRAWVAMSEGARMAVYVPHSGDPRPVRFKPSLRLVGAEVR